MRETGLAIGACRRRQEKVAPTAEIVEIGYIRHVPRCDMGLQGETAAKEATDIALSRKQVRSCAASRHCAISSCCRTPQQGLPGPSERVQGPRRLA